MYSTCIFCHSDLGANEVIETFPIGRRLAFDASKGRLWVICRKCERWNLTPIEERWEAVEQCEKLFTSTRLRVSSDNIGMSRLREGLELVRIGNPMRPEMAAWRYGDQFGRRRRKYILMTTGATVAIVGAYFAARYTGIAVGGGYGMWQLVNAARKATWERVPRVRLPLPGESHPTVLRGKEMKRIVLGARDGAWHIRVPINDSRWGKDTGRTTELHGDDALRAAASLMPAVNSKGGSAEEVSNAVRVLEQTPDTHRLFVQAAGQKKLDTPESRRRGILLSGETFIDRLPDATRLALEMAAHEDIERRAMEGELAILEQAWRQAEEIAAISDSMFLPAGVDEKLTRLSSG